MNRVTRKDSFHQRGWKMGRSRILVVEDYHDAAALMALLLEYWGYKPTVVYEGKKAIEVAPSLCPEVVFLDLGLPDMSGFEVARQLRRSPATASALIVAITGHGQTAVVQRCEAAGIDVHLLKPVDPEEIEKVLTFPSFEKRHAH
jgi:CheY-like chemotaxis protein